MVEIEEASNSTSFLLQCLYKKLYPYLQWKIFDIYYFRISRYNTWKDAVYFYIVFKHEMCFSQKCLLEFTDF